MAIWRPAPLRGDAFTLAHTQMTTAGFRYLRAIAAQDDATATATPQLLRWAQRRAGSPARRPRRVASRACCGRPSARSSDERWPPGARAQVSALRSHARALIALLSTDPARDRRRTTRLGGAV